jgi:Arc/MetJ-type ribon-helix-helix transcriptional regulator
MTIPADVLRRADQLARRWDRSRSWVIREAIRHLPDANAAESAWPRSVAEPTAATYPARLTPPGLDPFRQRQLTDDLALTPLDRVLAAERTAREVPPRTFATLIVSFERPEDYFAWEALEAAGLL